MKEWYKKDTNVILLCIFVPPLGLYLLWKHKLLSESKRTIIYLIFLFPVGVIKMYRDSVFSKSTRVIVTLVLISFVGFSYYYNKYIQITYCTTDNMSMGEEYKELDTDLKTEISFNSRDFKVGYIGSFTLTSSSSNKKIDYKGKVVRGKYTIIMNKNTRNKEVVCTPISVDGKEINYNEVSLRFEVLVFGVSNNNQTLTVISPGQHFHVNDSINVCE